MALGEAKISHLVYETTVLIIVNIVPKKSSLIILHYHHISHLKVRNNKSFAETMDKQLFRFLDKVIKKPGPKEDATKLPTMMFCIVSHLRDLIKPHPLLGRKKVLAPPTADQASVLNTLKLFQIMVEALRNSVALEARAIQSDDEASALSQTSKVFLTSKIWSCVVCIRCFCAVARIRGLGNLLTHSIYRLTWLCFSMLSFVHSLFVFTGPGSMIWPRLSRSIKSPLVTSSPG